MAKRGSRSAITRSGTSSSTKDISFKKKSARQRAGSSGRCRRRAQWKKYQGRLESGAPCLIDETWAKTNMTRTHGRAPRGERLIAKAPHGRWRTLTFLAAAPQRPHRCALRDRWADQWSKLPGLCRAGSGTCAQTRRHRHHRQFSAVTRARPYVRSIRAPAPNYSFCRPTAQTLNPIEQVFAKLKTLLRKAAERTVVETTWRRIGALLTCFTPQECAQLLRQRRIRFNVKQSCSSL